MLQNGIGTETECGRAGLQIIFAEYGLNKPKKILDDDDQNIPFIFFYSYCVFSYDFFSRPSVKKLFLSKAFGLIVYE